MGILKQLATVFALDHTATVAATAIRMVSHKYAELAVSRSKYSSIQTT